MMGHGLTTEPAEWLDVTVWRELASPRIPYEASSASESSLREPLHRMMHRLISSTISHKPSPEKISRIDLFLLWGLIDTTRLLNLPYILASYLHDRAPGPRSTAEVCGGNFITALAQSYEIDVSDLFSVQTTPMTQQYLRRMGVLDIRPNGTMLFASTPDVPLPAADQGRGRRRRMHEPPAQDEPAIDLRYLSSQLDGLGFYQDDLRSHQMHIDAQLYRMAQSQQTLLQQHQLQPPMPFMPTYPYYPDWQERREHGFQRYQPGGDVYGGGAGPSGTAQHDQQQQQEDEDEDDEEDEDYEDEEEEQDGEDDALYDGEVSDEVINLGDEEVEYDDEETEDDDDDE